MFKSIVFWTILYRFRKRVSIIIVLLAMIFFIQSIYKDSVEYLTLTNQVDIIIYLLPIKWGIIFINIGIISYLSLTILGKNNKAKKIIEDKKETTPPIKKTIKNLSKREKSFLHKNIRNEADILLDR